MGFKHKLTEDERIKMFEWLKESKGYSEISKLLNNKITRQRVKQIALKNNIDTFKERKEALNKIHVQKMFKKWGAEWNDKDFRKSLIYQTMKEKFRAKKHNSGKWEFSVDFGSLEFPTHCPILGIELDYFVENRGFQENSVSFDRINPLKGYVPGNVVIISWRANRIKNNGTAEEHQKIAVFMLKHAF
mgnify:CR=1 FL=1|tara:strand:+ start:431 stop:994 length:564 start_codon:yes stop_codon:yes gene_type:complete